MKTKILALVFSLIILLVPIYAADVVIRNGNIGIGTSDPGQKLDVGGTVNMSGFVMPTGASNGFVLTSNNVGVGTWQAAVGSSQWTTSGSNIYYNVVGGNVGIGATIPGNKLEVAGTVNMSGFMMSTGASNGFVLTSDASGTGTWQAGGGGALPAGALDQTLRHNGVNWVASSLLNNNGVDSIKVERNNEVYLNLRNTELGGRDWAIVSAGSAGGIGKGNFSIYDRTAGVSRLVINDNGNVGIGVASPSFRLDVSGTVNMNGFRMATGAANGRILTSDAQGGGTWVAVPSGASAWTRVAPNTYLSTTDNVGIGTTLPGQKLEVAGTVNMSGFRMATGAANGYVLTSGPTGVGTWQAIASSQWTTSGSNIYYNVVGGNVGIGTAAPSAELQVNDATGDSSIQLTSGATTRSVILGTNNGGSAPFIQVTQNSAIAASTWQSGVFSDNRFFIGHPGEIEKFTIQTNGDTTIRGKLTVTGGVDPPYVSFSDESHESIRGQAKNIDTHEKVMLFWNKGSHRMEVYVVAEDKFYTVDGEPVE